MIVTIYDDGVNRVTKLKPACKRMLHSVFLEKVQDKSMAFFFRLPLSSFFYGTYDRGYKENAEGSQDSSHCHISIFIRWQIPLRWSLIEVCFDGAAYFF